MTCHFLSWHDSTTHYHYVVGIGWFYHMFSPCFRPRRQPRSLLLWKWTAPVLLRFHQRRLRWSDLAMRCRSCMVTSKKIEKCFQDVSSMIFTSYFPLVQVSNFSSSVGYYNLSWCSWNFPVMFTDNFWETYRKLLQLNTTFIFVYTYTHAHSNDHISICCDMFTYHTYTVK